MEEFSVGLAGVEELSLGWADVEELSVGQQKCGVQSPQESDTVAGEHATKGWLLVITCLLVGAN